MQNRDSFAQQHVGADHIVSFFQKLRLDWLLLHFPPRLVRTLYMFVNGFVTIGVLAVLALVSRNPFVFPSLGPTAYLLFFTPLGRTSSPRNTVFGHAIGLICGYAAFAITGAGALPFGEHPGIFWPRVLAAALSLSATGAFMVFLDVSHPPAGATTLIVSLGIYCETGRARYHRGGRVPARCAGSRDQSTRGTAISVVERSRSDRP